MVGTCSRWLPALWHASAWLRPSSGLPRQPSLLRGQSLSRRAKAIRVLAAMASPPLPAGSAAPVARPRPPSRPAHPGRCSSCRFRGRAVLGPPFEGSTCSPPTRLPDDLRCRSSPSTSQRRLSMRTFLTTLLLLLAFGATAHAAQPCCDDQPCCDEGNSCCDE